MGLCVIFVLPCSCPIVKDVKRGGKDLLCGNGCQEGGDVSGEGLIWEVDAWSPTGSFLVSAVERHVEHGGLVGCFYS